MARRGTSTGSARSNEMDSAADNAADAGSSSHAGTDSGADASNAQGGGDASSGAQGGGDGSPNTQGGEAPPPVKRRKRGPNKPKPGAFDVETKARMRHDEIIKLLTAHAAAQLGTDTAARMTLQVLVEGEVRALGDVLPPGATLQFATVVKADE